MKKQLFNLKNKIVVITGGSGFLGSEFSFSLSDIGAIPVILDKNKTSLEILKKKFKKKRKKGSFFLVDLNDEIKVNAAINLVIKKYRRIDCLINAAGFTHTSVAIRDALSLFKKPIIELHISNIYKRESNQDKEEEHLGLAVKFSSIPYNRHSLELALAELYVDRGTEEMAMEIVQKILNLENISSGNKKKAEKLSGFLTRK